MCLSTPPSWPEYKVLKQARLIYCGKSQNSNCFFGDEEGTDWEGAGRTEGLGFQRCMQLSKLSKSVSEVCGGHVLFSKAKELRGYSPGLVSFEV